MRSGALSILAFLGTAGCELLSDVELPGETLGPSGRVHLWLGADRDAWVSAGAREPQEANYGGSNDLRVGFALNGDTVTRTYVNFTLPILPEGTTVEAAHLNLYHPATRGDGTPDEIDIPVMTAPEPWSPMVVTAANTSPFTPGFTTSLALESDAWCGTGDLSALVADAIANPDSFHGFVLYWNATAGQDAQKAFWSNQHQSRTVESLGLAPRLLMRITLPAGANMSDIQMPSMLPADTDLSFGVAVNILETRPGDAWPEDWDVALGDRG